MNLTAILRRSLAVFLLVPGSTAFAGSSRVLDGATITVGSPSNVLTLPQTTDTVVARNTTDTLTNKSISGSTNTLSNIPVSALSTGTAIGVNTGGTGATTLTANGVLLGNTTSAITATAAGSALQTFQVPSGGGAPVFTSHVPPLTLATWNESSVSPLPLVVANQRVYDFSPGLPQALYAAIQVPTLYIAGNQIHAKLSCFSASYSSGTDLIQAIATLVRPGTDNVGSTTNQHVSSNTAQTPAGTLIPYTVSLDLTDSSGKINSVSVAASNVIQVQLQRGTDTDASDIQCLINTEVTFQ